MNDKIFFHVDQNGNGLVLETTGEILEDFSDTPDVSEWPSSFRESAYEKSGLSVWEGEVTKGDNGYVFAGECRDPRPDEWNRLKRKDPIFGE